MIAFLHRKIDEIDWELAKKDVADFIADKRKLDIWSKQFFYDVISHLLDGLTGHNF